MPLAVSFMEACAMESAASTTTVIDRAGPPSVKQASEMVELGMPPCSLALVAAGYDST